MAKVTVLICCANAGQTLEAACRSAAWADELVVVDSGSTDQTATIAKRYADKYVVEPWRGYREQKLWALGQCAHEWVFILDGDEEIAAGLAKEIGGLSQAAMEKVDVWHVRRRNYVMGRAVRAWWPDWQTRLIHRQRAVWPEQTLHDTCLPSERGRDRRLGGHLEHKRVGDHRFADYFSGQRMDERLILLAKQMHGRGKRARLVDVLFRPAMAFLKFYVVKRGFLDGAFGLLIAQKAAVSVQLKYAALWAVERGIRLEGEEQAKTNGEDAG